MGNSSARIRQLKKSRESRVGITSVEDTIERSKCQWSSLVESGSNEEDVAEMSNVEAFKTLQMHSTWDTFFKPFGKGEGGVCDLVLCKKFAEGRQAELYEALVKWRSPRILQHWRKELRRKEWVLKVFKKGTYLRHLQSQWPQGMLQFRAEEVENWKSIRPNQVPMYQCNVYCGTLLKDGRFAFLLEREHGDLWSLIDCKILRIGQDCGPFSKEVAKKIISDVTIWCSWYGLVAQSQHCSLRPQGMQCACIEDNDEGYLCYVADYECSIGVVGTGFFRTPEIW